jgi:general secretion pathway protein G
MRRYPRGLTLIEIIVVITILSLLMAAVGVYAIQQLVDSKRSIARIDVRNALDAVETYRVTKGRYPSTAEGFRAVVEARVLKRLPKDPWGTPLGYALESGEPVVTSFGADGTEGGQGEDLDVSSRDLDDAPDRGRAEARN